MHTQVWLSVGLVCFGASSLAAIAPAPLPAKAAAAVYTVDPVHSITLFRVKHLGVSYSYGRFKDVAGSFAFDAADPSKCSIEMSVKTASVETGDLKRDEHLKSPDFFNEKQFGAITFKSTKVEKRDDTHFTVTGDFAMHGVTKSIKVEIEKVGEGKDPMGGYRMGFETTFTLKRSDFGMKYGVPDMVGDDVRVTISVEGIRK